MAIKWYLLNRSSDAANGFDNDEYNGDVGGVFADGAETSVGCDIDVLNYDLSECKRIRAIVQNNVQDTKLKTLSRQVLLPIGSCKAGMYIRYKNRYWLIVGLVDDNTMYEKAIITLCNYYLTWINENGSIIQRWVSISSASQYNHGETSTDNYWVRSDQLMILTPDDDECLLINTSQRFIIDKRCKVYEKNFAHNVDKDLSKPVIVYKLTRSDSVLFDYQDSGHYEFMAYQDEQNEYDGYYMVDGKGYWLCQEPIINKNHSLSCLIESDAMEIIDGLEASEFIARFHDINGNVVNVKPQWKILCDFADGLDITYVGNSILISTDNPKLINKSFDLSLTAEGYNTATATITIKAFL